METNPEFQNSLIQEVKSAVAEVTKKEEDKEWMNALVEYMTYGTMPHSFYSKLPKGVQKTYREKFHHRPDHIHGRPRTLNEQKIARKHRVKKRKKAKAAKQARKVNR